jgi:hypothetical protein
MERPLERLLERMRGRGCKLQMKSEGWSSVRADLHALPDLIVAVKRGAKAATVHFRACDAALTLTLVRHENELEHVSLELGAAEPDLQRLLMCCALYLVGDAPGRVPVSVRAGEPLLLSSLQDLRERCQASSD